MTAITYRQIQSPTPSNFDHSSPSSTESVIKFEFDKVRYATDSLDFPSINHSLPRWQESKRVKQFEFKKNLDPWLTKKEIRKHQRVEILKSLEIPVAETNLKELLAKIPEIKTEFAKDFLNKRTLTFPVQINKQPYRIEAHPRKDENGVDIFLFSTKETHEIDSGSFKIYFNGWSLTKAPKHLAIGVSKPRMFASCKQSYVAEANFTDALNASKLFGRLFKCSYFEDSNNQVDGQVLIMKYCPEILFDKLNDIICVLKTKKRMTDIEKLDLAIDFISALNYLHSQEIVHRDLKAENILLNKKGCPVICDFGFAAKSSNKEALTLFKGTLDYLPYEFFTNYPTNTQRNSTIKRFDFSEWSPQQGYALDIWSSGIILYTLFNLGAPSWVYALKEKKQFSLDDLDKIINSMEQFHKNEPDAESKRLRHLIWQMLHLDPLQRPQTSEILDELKEIRAPLQEDSYDFDYQFPDARALRLDLRYPFLE